MKYLITPITVSLFLSLNLIGQNTILDKYFTEDETTTINEILNQFDQTIKLKTKNTEIVQAYMDFSYYLKTADSVEEFYDRMFTIKPQIDSIINRYKNTDFFKDTWYYNHGFRYPVVTDTVSTMLEINKDSKYIDLLKYRKRKTKSLKDYYSTFMSTYGITPTMVFPFPYVIETLDLTDKSVRLIIAVHFITIISETKKPVVNKG